LIVVCDALSALAIHTNTVAVITRFLEILKKQGLKVAPVIIVTSERVAVADEVNDFVKAKVSRKFNRGKTWPKLS
jgi:ethanolamine ammonia-lyase small subunit